MRIFQKVRVNAVAFSRGTLEIHLASNLKNKPQTGRKKYLLNKIKKKKRTKILN